MFWSQAENPDDVTVPDGIVDILFSLDARRLPVDHAYDLAAALVRACPWLADEPELGVHSIHVAGSQNGWERPSHGTGNHLELSRRTKLALRAPRARVAELLGALPGARLQVADCPLILGAGKVRPLSKETTLFARYLVADRSAGPEPDEDQFLQWAVQALGELGIRVRKALCGKPTRLTTPDGPILTRSLLLANLGIAESLHLQQSGLGPHRLLGCGIFIPHKGIDAVNPTP